MTEHEQQPWNLDRIYDYVERMKRQAIIEGRLCDTVSTSQAEGLAEEVYDAWQADREGLLQRIAELESPLNGHEEAYRIDGDDEIEDDDEQQ